MQRSEPSPVGNWDRDSTRRVLDELFTLARTFNLSKAYLELMEFVGRFRFYSPFNAMLIYTQMPGARFVATPIRWMRDFHREIRVGARPIVILQPMGPVLFVFDVTDTDALPGAPPLPQRVNNPFKVRHGKIGNELKHTIENAKRDGVRISDADHGSQRAGSIQRASGHQFLEVLAAPKPHLRLKRVPLLYELLLNNNLSSESKYATLVHELGHLYCGHLGTRRGLQIEVCEFEAESVCYLVCTRMGLENASEEYLAGYVRKHETTPSISLDRVMKSSWLIEQMGKKRLKLRRENAGEPLA